MAIEIVKLIDSPVHLNFTGGITPKGSYVAETTYNTGESVSYLGSSYVAIQETTGNLPTNIIYWQLLSLKGDGAITGGTTGQVLAKASNADFDNQWITPKSALADFSQDASHRLVTDTLIENWNTAYGWGDHAGLYDPLNSASSALSGHLTAFDHGLIATALQSETDPVFTAWDKSTGISITESQISDLKTYIQSSEKGANNGVATLDAGGKVPTTQLPATLLIYKGVWNATTNTPELLATDTTKKGWVYNVSVEGTQFGIDWKLGDWAIYNDSGVLEKSDNSDDVVSVNGQQGVVVLNADHISDTSTTNKWTTLAEKSIWNAKQDAGLSWLLNGNTLGSKKTLGSIDNKPIGFITNNTEKMTILANGNVGIGTTNPGATLEVVGNTSYAPLKISRASNDKQIGVSYYPAGALSNSNKAWIMGLEENSNDFSFYNWNGSTINNLLYLTNTNNVGIGTNNPTGKFVIKQSGGNWTDGLNIERSTTTDKFHFTHDTTGRLLIGYNSARALGIFSSGISVGSYATTTPPSGGMIIPGNVGIGTNNPTAKLDVDSDILRLRVPKTPETSGSAGNKGDYCWDANYLYVCIDTNTWKRSSLETW